VARSGFACATFAAAFSISLAIFPHETRAIAFLFSSPHLSPQAHEENQMRSLKSIGQKSLGVLSSLAIAAGASAQDAMQWRVEDGGNGHWYQIGIASTAISWNSAFASAQRTGGHLATATSASELSFLLTPQLAGDSSAWRTSVSPQGTYWIGPWLGGFQDANAPGFVEPNGGWRWVTGEQWSFTNWTFPEPNDAYGGGENHLHLLGQPPSTGPVGSWNDALANAAGSLIVSYLIEWSADCNSDGIVDYGQIRAGELEDANGNNIPDCCEQSTSCEPCAADIDGSGTVNAVDLAAILTVWGTDGGKYPNADIDGDGEVNGPDLAAVLSNWGSCP
jgi:hypothetical protein